jgi:LEA14-like dessication related protein
MSRRIPRPRSLLLPALAAALAAGLAACAVLEQAGVERPRVSLETTRVASLSLADVDLVLGFAIDNPNPVGVRFDRFDYRLSVAGAQLAQGEQRRGVELAAGGRSWVEIPVSVGWSDLNAIYRSLRSGDRPGYRLESGFWFDLPIVGPLRVPLTREGDFPVLRLPRLALSDLDVGRIDASGARLELVLALENPNDFPLTVRGLDSVVELGGQRVAEVAEGGGVTVERGGHGTWRIPVSVDFATAGRALAQTLTSGGSLSYGLRGDLEIDSTSEWIDDTRVPVDSRGTVRLR